MEIVLVLDNIRSTHNVGAILRTAEGFGVSQVICSGYTPFPGVEAGRLPHVSEKETAAIAKTALGAEKLLNLSYHEEITGVLREMKEQGWQLVGLENNIADTRMCAITDPILPERLGQKIVLVMGEEVHGIRADVLDLMDLLLEIPMRGQKESFNVSVATGIALFQLDTIRTKQLL